MSATAAPLPTHARVVVIGGGAIGLSVAYHLARLGWTDVVLLERDRLTSGTTWHAAGLIASAGLSSETLLWSQQYTRRLLPELESETGLSTGFRAIGHLHLATNATRREGQRRELNFARSQGVEKHELSPAEIKALFPLLETADVLSGIYTPGDGRANPVDVAMAYAKAARQRGVRIVEGAQVTGITVRDRRVRGVRTAHGDVATDAVVLAAGMWSRQIAAENGVPVPLQAAEHYYLLTEPMPGIHGELPVVEDPEAYAYLREEGGGLLFGMFEPEGAIWSPGRVPDDASFLTLPPDWERMTPFLERAFERLPAMRETGIRTFFCGPESFTPDGAFVVGEAPECDGLFLAAGLNSLGILSSGGVGAIVAELVATGDASQDVTGWLPGRAPAHEATRWFLADRTPATLGYVFSHAGRPHWKHSTARDARRLVLHDRYAALGASFTALGGWEMPRWFAADPALRSVEYRYGRQPWFDCVAAEHRATRESAALFDKSFMGKFLVQGRDAARVLDRVSANVLPAPGYNVYTQWLNERGGIVADLTITALEGGAYLVVVSDVLQRFVPAWLRRHRAPDEHCSVADLTSAYTLLSLQGPRSREVLEAATGADLSTARVPYRASLHVDVGYARVLAVRVTYMGELGYELYVPAEYSHTVYEALLAAFARTGLPAVHAGLVALEGLRLEKGYRDYAVDIDNTDTPLTAGLGFAVAFDKGEFVGRTALLAARAQGSPARRLVQLVLEDPEPILMHHEPVLCGGHYCGYLRAGAYGHTLGASVGLGVVEHPGGVTAEWLRTQAFEVEVGDRRYAARASFAPLYDPKGERVRA
ncbi:MAG: FAD-dependent oxidoreductase [Steroidobacteraceae bacterium]